LCCKEDSDQDSYFLDQDWSRTRKNLSPNTSALHQTGNRGSSQRDIARERFFYGVSCILKYWHVRLLCDCFSLKTESRGKSAFPKALMTKSFNHVFLISSSTTCVQWRNVGV